jgi:hypothetical protein
MGKWDSNISYCKKKHGTVAGKGVKFETYTNGVWHLLWETSKVKNV